MADNHFRINKGASFVPQTGAPTNPSNGDIYFDSTIGKFQQYISGAWSDIGSGSNISGGNVIAAILASTPGADNTGTGTLNNVSTANFSFFRFTNNTGPTITGFANGSSGKQLIIAYTGSGTLTINNNDSGSLAANRIITSSGSAISLTTDSAVLFIYDATASLWRQVGGAGGTTITAGSDGQVYKSEGSTAFFSSYVTPQVNYIGNAMAEVNTSGWATYSNTAQNIPVSGTGGTATGLTFSRNTSSPMRGSADFKLVQTNSTNVQGKGVSYDFNIDPADQARVLSVQFEYNASSTFVASDGITAPKNDATTSTNSGNSDIEVFIYDKTNSQLIYVTPQVLASNGSNNFQFKGTFQTASNSTSYRLIFHVATNNANATGWTFKWSNVYVGPQIAVNGPAISDWTSFTMTITATTTNPTKGTVVRDEARWRRVGDSMEIQYNYQQSAGGSAGSGSYRFALPSGYSIDSSKLSPVAEAGSPPSQEGGSSVGSGAWSTGTTNLVGDVRAIDTTHLDLLLAAPTLSQCAQMSSSFADLGQASTFSFHALVPISGWSANVSMSQDTDTRIVSARYNSTSGQTLSGSNIVNFENKEWDTHAAVTTGSPWKFTAPVSGYYFVSAAIQYTTSQTATMYIYKNGTVNTDLMGLSGQTGRFGAAMVQLNAGDYIDIRSTVSVQLSATSNENYVIITRMSGPATIAATDSVNAKYYSSSPVSPGANVQVNFNTKVFDSHNAVTTGGSWKFTAPASGTYCVSAAVADTDGSSHSFQLFKNGTADTYMFTSNTTQLASGTTLIKLIAGDFIDLRPDGSITTSSNTSPINTWICIHRVGN